MINEDTQIGIKSMPLTYTKLGSSIGFATGVGYAFYKKTGIPMLLNTSMNVNGRPIASRYTDALELISTTELDMLVIGNEIYKR